MPGGPSARRGGGAAPPPQRRCRRYHGSANTASLSLVDVVRAPKPGNCTVFVPAVMSTAMYCLPLTAYVIAGAMIRLEFGARDINAVARTVPLAATRVVLGAVRCIGCDGSGQSGSRSDDSRSEQAGDGDRGASPGSVVVSRGRSSGASR